MPRRQLAAHAHDLHASLGDNTHRRELKRLEQLTLGPAQAFR